MIATCPACGKRYRLPDDAVPAAGRNVRCAACGHNWTVRPDAADRATAAAAPDDGPAAAAATAAAPLPGSAEVVAMTSPAATSPGRPTVVSAADAGAAPTPLQAAWSPDGDAPPRRRWGWFVAALLVAVALAAAAVVEFAPADTFDPPRLGLPAPAELRALAGDVPPLDLTRLPVVGAALDRLVHPPAAPPSSLRATARGERRILANGTRVLTVTGTVANPTAAPVALAGIDAALLDARGHAVVRWRIAAPQSVIAPHGSAAFESVEANFPAGATTLELTPR